MTAPRAGGHAEPPSPTVDVFEAMGTARAMRWLHPDPVPAPVLDRVLWAATRASSPDNTQCWDFVVVQDREVRARIGALLARRAPATTPVADVAPRTTGERTRAGAMHLMRAMADVPVIVFVCGVNAYPPAAPDVATMYSAVYAAAQNMIVAARASGLGAVLTTFHHMIEPELRELLGIPDDRVLAATVPLGRPARPFGPVTRRPMDEVVHHDHW